MGKKENPVERRLVERAEALGGRCIKITSPGLRGIPDRLRLLPIENAEHRYIVSRYVAFIECKAPDGKPARPDQVAEIENLRDMGYCAFILDSLL